MSVIVPTSKYEALLAEELARVNGRVRALEARVRAVEAAAVLLALSWAAVWMWR